jgi:hypothetical protein
LNYSRQSWFNTGLSGDKYQIAEIGQEGTIKGAGVYRLAWNYASVIIATGLLTKDFKRWE